MPSAISRTDELAEAEQLIDKFYLGTISHKELAKAVGLKWFRLNCFYYIKDKNGKKVKFRPNPEQRRYYLNGHNRDVILKARQLGFTTFKMISSLDECLFHKDFGAGVICHSLDDARDIFRNKIKYAYQHLKREDINRLFAGLHKTGHTKGLYQLPTAAMDQAAHTFSATARAFALAQATEAAHSRICTSQSSARYAASIPRRPKRSLPALTRPLVLTALSRWSLPLRAERGDSLTPAKTLSTCTN